MKLKAVTHSKLLGDISQGKARIMSFSDTSGSSLDDVVAPRQEVDIEDEVSKCTLVVPMSNSAFLVY